MDGLELKEYFLADGTLEWRAVNGKEVVMRMKDRVALVRALRKRFNT